MSRSRAPLLVLASVVSTMGALASVSSTAHAEDFTYAPPGELVPGSGTGRVDNNVYAPNMRFPIETGPAFANSQVWGVGGSQGPAGDQCSLPNFSYPWHDNYCEERTWDMPLCPSGTGHQGQDTRAATCDKNVHWVVAAESGAVTSVGSYSVYITAADGTRYDYLHMGSVQVAVGDDVTKGQHIGKVSNEFGGTPTSVHLHFNLRQNVAGVGTVYVPPYLSLVTAYQALIGPAGALDEASCDGIRGWAASPGDASVPIEARLYFDGTAGDGKTVGHPVLADVARDDLCSVLGDCNHGFEVAPPLSLLDGATHTVHAYASDGSPSLPELGGSPKELSCTFELPSGVRRKIAGLDAQNAWHFSEFWDQLEVSDGVIDSLPEGVALGDAPRVVVSSADPDAMWVVDHGKKRRVPSALVARAWDLDAATAESLDAAALADLPDGVDLRPRPVVLRSATGDLWLVDDPETPSLPSGSSGAGGGGGDGLDAESGDGCSCLVAGDDSSFSGRWLGLTGFAVLLGLAGARRSSRRVGR
jgi:murein DD-endopeptidase MepM/ murein hydrolase activator NlpD